MAHGSATSSPDRVSGNGQGAEGCVPLVDNAATTPDNHRSGTNANVEEKRGGHDDSDAQGASGRSAGDRGTSHGGGLGPHPARLEGGPLVPPDPRRLLLRPDPGRRRGRAAELSGPDPPPHDAL